MTLVLTFLLFICCLFGQRPLTSLSLIAERLQRECLKQAPEEQHAIHQALVCGQPLADGPVKLVFQQSSLIHILVVSGSHLLFLLSVCRWLQLKKSWQAAVLLLFTLMCGLQAPLVRSLLGLALSALSDRFRLNWHPAQVVFYSGLSSLILDLSWAASYSLLLSWTAAFTLTCLNRSKLPAFCRETLMWLSLTPMLLNLSAPGPQSIAWNVLLAPVIGQLLFPFSILCFVVKPLAGWFSVVWESLVWVLHLSPANETTQASLSVPLSALWIYLFTLHTLFECHLRGRR